MMTSMATLPVAETRPDADAADAETRRPEPGARDRYPPTGSQSGIYLESHRIAAALGCARSRRHGESLGVPNE